MAKAQVRHGPVSMWPEKSKLVGLQMWEYEGSRTLAHYLRKKDCVEHLAADLDVPYESAVPIVMKQIFECLAVRAATSCLRPSISSKMPGQQSDASLIFFDLTRTAPC